MHLEGLVENKIIIDTHTHTHNSIDSKLSFEDLLEGARVAGVKILTVTDHCDLFPGSGKEELKNAQESFDETAIYQKKIDDIKILKGIEIGGLCHNPNVAQEVLDKDYDFVLGSIHNIRNTEDFYFMDYQNVDVHEKLSIYFEECLEMVLTEKIDSLAHLTYPIRYINGNFKMGISLGNHEIIIREILNQLIKKEICLEINTGGVRKLIGEISPEYDIIQKYYDLGGRLITIGSDAHYKEHVGMDIYSCMGRLKAIGFKEIAYHIQRKPHFATL